MESLEVIEFKGIRNDLGRKFSGDNYLHRCINFGFDDIVGANQEKMPEIKFNGETDESLDGSFEFNYIDSNSENITQNIIIYGGNVYRGLFSTLILIYSSLTPGKRCDFAVSNDRLFISNGVDIPVVYNGEVAWQMGAPNISNSLDSGILTGEYFYEMTWTIGGIESRSGSISNILNVSSSKIALDIPIGVSDTTERTLYRTESNGSVTKLLTVINNNTTTEFLDNIPDSSLGVDIFEINDPMPIPEFITVSFDKLVGCSVKKRPQRIYFTDTNKEFFTNIRNTLDISTFGNDNSPLRGMEPDYNQIVVGSERFLYLVDVSGETGIVRQTNDNIGVKDGHTMINIPANEVFEGGIIFASTLNDFRLFNGNIPDQSGTGLDNLRSYNISQVLRGTLKDELEVSTEISSIFFDYKYIVGINNIIYIFDIRGQKWSTMNIVTDNFSSIPYSWAIFDSKLFLGQKDVSVLEEMFTSYKYREEEPQNIIQSNQLLSSSEFKYFTEFYFYYTTASDCELEINIIIEGNIKDTITERIELREGNFSSIDFFDPDFSVLSDDEDYKMMHINRYGRWIEFDIEVISGRFNFRGFKMLYKPTFNK